MNDKIFYKKIKKLYYLLAREDRKFLLVLIIMSIFLSIIETIGIASLMPFISIVTDSNLIYENSYYLMMYNFFDLKSSKEFIIYLGVLLILFYLFRAMYSIYYTYLQNKFAMKKYQKLTNKLFTNYLYMLYKDFVLKNSASMSKAIISESHQLSYIVQFSLVFISETLIIVFLYIILLFVDAYMTLTLTMFFFLMIIILTKTVSQKIKIKGEERAIVQEKFYKIVNETFGNFKFIKFASNQNIIISNFKSVSEEYANVYTYNNTLQDIPRNMLEAIGLSTLIGIIIYISIFTDNLSNLIPMIAMYALALYRLLPAITRIITSYNGIVFYFTSLEIVYKDIKISTIQEFEGQLKYDNIIYIKNISFAYNNKDTIINNVSLQIEKGKKIAFIGESGSGKSTLVDLICGIYKPNSGEILIDNVVLNNSNIVSWRKKIGYIPQSIYLFDGTIAQNVSFGREYSEEKIIEVLKQANIYDTLMEKYGLATLVGEGGIQLSGGQKQRIGIARALYGDPEILVLDEATSALDTKTEQAIMDEIYKISEDKTLMIIAHRLSTIEKCDVKIDMSEVNKID